MVQMRSIEGASLVIHFTHASVCLTAVVLFSADNAEDVEHIDKDQRLQCSCWLLSFYLRDL